MSAPEVQSDSGRHDEPAWHALMAARLRVVEVSVEHLTHQMSEISVLMPELRKHIEQEAGNHMQHLDAIEKQAEAMRHLADKMSQMSDMVEAWTSLKGAGRLIGWISSSATKFVAVIGGFSLLGALIYAVGHLAVTGELPRLAK